MAELQHSRRHWLAHALSTVTVGGCMSSTGIREGFSTPTGFEVSAVPEWRYRAWNDPENLKLWDSLLSLDRRMRWTAQEGLAVSAGGKVAAVPVGASAINAITLAAHESDEVWRIAHPNPRIQLSHPTFSPDGETIAVVASPPTYFGDCEIWIAPVRGGRARVIRASEPRSMYWPAFSRDGLRVACFRDVAPSQEYRQIKREYAPYPYCALFEYDLETSEETKINDLVVDAANARFGYGARSDMFLVGFDGIARFAAEERYSNGETGYREDIGPLQPAGQTDGRRLFELRRGAPVKRFPEPAKPGLLKAGLFDKSASFCGVDRSGNVLIKSLKRAYACNDERIVQVLDLERSRSGAGHDNFETCAISSDGSAIAGTTPRGFVNEGTRLDLMHDGEIKTFALQPSDLGASPVHLITADSRSSRFPE